MSNAQPALLVAQSGGCTAAINASLAGVFAAAADSGAIGPILGARFGVDGLLARAFLDLRAQPREIWQSIRVTPSAALGSGRRHLSVEECAEVVRICEDLHVGYLLYIGGNDSADTALRVHHAARAAGTDLRVVLVPKTIDNDLPGTDHCPGFGSAARFIAQTTQDASLDTEAMRATDPIKIIEVMGRDAGWLAAASVFGKRCDADPPHVVCVPERPLDVDAFIGAVERAYRGHGYAVAVVPETIRDLKGRPLGAVHAIQQRDAFGHPTLAGAAQVLTQIVGEALRVKARFDKPGTIQRMCMALASSVDLEEAFTAGRQAVQFALAGLSGYMVGFQRVSAAPYRVEMTPLDLQLVANRHRPLPPEYLGDDPFSIAPAYHDYLRPLIDPPLLTYARLLPPSESRT